MKVTLLADSCFLFKSGGTTLMTDPWLGTRINNGAWVQFPAPKFDFSLLETVNWVFISHIHQDHCDLETIRRLPTRAKFLLMQRTPNFVKRLLEYSGDGYEVVEIPLRTRLPLEDGMEVEVLDADPEHTYNNALDSSLLIHVGDETILFANDNLPYPGQIKYLEQFQIKLAILPPCGGSGYPAFYTNLSDSEKMRRRDEIASDYLQKASECLMLLNPEYFCWSGHSHLLAGANAARNKFMSWPRSGAEPYQFLERHFGSSFGPSPLLLSSGAEVDLLSPPGRVSLNQAISFFEDSEQRARFVEEEVLLSERYSFEYLDQPGPGCDIISLLEIAFRRFVEGASRLEIGENWEIEIDWGAGKATISSAHPDGWSFSPGGHAHTDRNLLRITLDQRLLVLLLTGMASWNMADASGFISYFREPDTYCNELYMALNYLKI